MNAQKLQTLGKGHFFNTFIIKYTWDVTNTDLPRMHSKNLKNNTKMSKSESFNFVI